MRAWQGNQLGNFIAGWYIDNSEFLARLRSYADHNPDQAWALTRYGSVDPLVKHSRDSRLNENTALFLEYKSHLQSVLDQYIQLYPWSNSYSAFDLEYPVVCQSYPPGGGFLRWHTERVVGNSSRHLVFMTYLNTVDRDMGGQTEFLHQNLLIQPEQGLTLIWPTDWTHTHRGRPATVAKTVVTGWFRFLR